VPKLVQRKNCIKESYYLNILGLFLSSSSVTKTINNDFNISWGQNEKDQIKQSAGKGKPVSVLDYNQNMGETDLKDESFIHKLWKEKKRTKWETRMFMRLQNATILN
jgi:hypothetical protein